MKVWGNGLGEVLGDALAVNKPVYASGDVWYVYSVSGVDAGGTAGQDREKPLATLGQAITNAAAGDTIVCKDGHAEVLTAALSISKQLFIVGGGSSGGVPTVTFTMNAAAQDTFSLSVANTEIRNLRFPAASQSNAGSSGGKITVTAAGCRIRGCYFDMGANDQLAGIRLGAASGPVRIESCTLISTATAVATRPSSAINVASAISDVELVNVTLSDGTVGFTNGAFASSAVIITRLRAENLALLLGAEFLLNASTAHLEYGVTQSGGGRISG
jgi:hypothetical protein